MRLTEYAKSDIRRKIINDLYAKSIADIERRQDQLTREAFEYAMEPHRPILAQLPKELCSHVKSAQLHIIYESAPDSEGNTQTLNERWVVSFTNAEMGFIDHNSSSMYVHTPASIKLDKRQYATAHELIKDTLALREERTKLENYLVETMAEFSGTLQLLKIWPDTLHKYLPPEPERESKPKSAKKKLVGLVPTAAPIDIKSRLTRNLLEDN